MKTLDEKVVLWMNSFENLSPKRRADLLALAPTPYEFWKNFVSLKSKIESLASEKVYNDLYAKYDNAIVSDMLKELEENRVNFTTYISEDYPQNLRSCENPPLALLYRGNIKLCERLCVSIVGSRKLTAYGRETTYRFAYELARLGFCIVSGLAYGADKTAHEGALAAGGDTIAVIGNGLKDIYPAANQMLAEKIIKSGGLIVSEYMPSSAPLAHHFPQRNRIISALSESLIVTEAAIKSGALITADLALEQGKNVFFVPGNITSRMSEGTNDRIKKGAGAMVTCVDDILLELGVQIRDNKDELPQKELSDGEKKILDFVHDEPKHMEAILEYTKMDFKSLSALLADMEMDGKILKLPGNLYK